MENYKIGNKVASSAEDWQDEDEDMSHAADWDNPVGITKA